MRPARDTPAGLRCTPPLPQDLAHVFHLPSSQACEALGVGLTIFKRLCRKFGLRRWPYRSLKKQVGALGDRGESVPASLRLRVCWGCHGAARWVTAGAHIHGAAWRGASGLIPTTAVC